MPTTGGGDAGPLSLDQTSRTEWDIVMTRNDRWVTCASGIADPGELSQRLDFLRWGTPSGPVPFHVLERVITLHERLLNPEDLPAAPSADIDVSSPTPATTAAVSVSAAAAAADNRGSAPPNPRSTSSEATTLSTDLEQLQRIELERALQTLEAHLTDAAAEVRRQRLSITEAELPAPAETYSGAAARAQRAVLTALFNAGIDTLVRRAVAAESARSDSGTNPATQ